MNLDDFERSGDRRHPRFVTQVQDVSGDEKFELTIAGPEALVQEVLGEATIELTIDSAQSADDVKSRLGELSAEQRRQIWTLAGLEDVDELFKPEPAWPQRDKSVLAAVRPVGGEGTPFAITTSAFTVPAGASFFFFGSFVGFAIGTVLPTTGDQDLFLRLFTPTGPVVSSSRASFTALDVVWFTFPFPFVPVFEVQGFTTGVCSNFSANGA
jgi:hypothetical protein